MPLDLTQDYFTRLLKKDTVAAADSVRGRFRSFLLADCGFFLADRRDHDRARKRGGGRVPLPIDARDAEGRFLHEPAHDQTPERLYERDWAPALLGRVFFRLERHYEAADRGDVFRRLKPSLSADPEATPYAELAAELGATEGSLRVAVHRTRAPFADELRDEIAPTLDDPTPDGVDAELRDLFDVLGP